MALNTILDKIKKAIDRFSMIETGDSVLVGFSGGKDSVVLLHALNSLADTYNMSVTAIHVNHNIRGNEAKRDMLFCESFCKANNIDFVSFDVDAVGFSQNNKIGLEEGARILRYNAFSQVCNQKNIKKIATAHTASDNLETVIFNLVRGSAASGMKGIPPVRDNIIRPLIYCSTEEILEYTNFFNLNFVTDSTNADTDYTRNHIRHNIVPQLHKINPSAENAVSAMCDAVRLDLNYISACVDNINTDSTQELAVLHPSLLTRVLLDMYNSTSNDGALSSVHLTEMTELLYGYCDNNCREVKKLSLPGKINFVITPQKVFFEIQTQNVCLKKRALAFGLNKFEETNEGMLVTENEDSLIEVLSKNIYKKSIHTIVKKSSLAGTIIRGRENGDVFCFSNMTKKVKKMLNEAKIPLDKRNTLPLICDKKGILWIPGFPLRDDAVPSPDDEKVYLYYLTQETNHDQ